MLSLRVSFFVSILFLCSPLSAKTLLIAHPPHNHIESLIPLIERSYSALGYRVEFVEIVVERRLVALNEGMIDAIVAGGPDLQERFENIHKVPVPLVKGGTFLLCQPELICDTNVLFNPDNTVFSAHQDTLRIAPYLPNPTQVTFKYFERPNSLITFMIQKRADYVLVTAKHNDVTFGQKGDFKSHKLIDLTGFHYVANHLKHEIPNLTREITKQQALLKKAQ